MEKYLDPRAITHLYKLFKPQAALLPIKNKKYSLISDKGNKADKYCGKSFYLLRSSDPFYQEKQ
jgi:hypothetical protein